MAMTCVSGASECVGCMDCYPDPPVCHICGEEADTLYYDRDGELFGCDVCVEKKSVWEAARDA